MATQTNSRIIEILGYYIQNTERGFFDSQSLGNAYGELDLAKPANFADYLSKMKNRRLLVKYSSGYRLSKAVSDRILSELGNPSLTAVSSELERLPTVLKGYEVSFLQESINCLRVRAWRATVVMSWALTTSHLQEYVLATSLPAFNAALKRNSRYAGISVRSKRDFEDIKDVDFIQTLRSAGILTNDQKKILDENLGIRNSCAHPSGLVITESKVTAFLEDIVYNILGEFELPH